MSSSMTSHRNGENVSVSFQSPRHSRSRRNRGKFLAPLADSSEEEPSPHSSIFEAPLVSDSENEGCPVKESPEAKVIIIPGPGTAGGGQETAMAISSLVSAEAVQSVAGGAAVEGSARADSSSVTSRRNNLLAHGLETIAEQKSNTTLRQGTITAQEDGGSGTEESEDEYEDGEYTELLPRGRRKKAFFGSSTRGEYTDYYDVGEIYDYASPSQPLYQSISALNAPDPSLSPATPNPGGTPPVSASFFNRNYSPSSPIRTPLQGPTFRPPTSGYRSYGSLTNHPFHNAPIARTDRGGGTSRILEGLDSGTTTPDSLSPREGRSRTASASERSLGGSGGRGGASWVLRDVICGVFCCVRGRREDD